MAGSIRSDTAVRRAFERALVLYDELATSLTSVIMRLRAQADGDRALERDEIELIKSHQKAVLMVLDFEAQLFKRRIGAAIAGDRAIDLDAARAEIVSRLSRLADASCA